MSLWVFCALFGFCRAHCVVVPLCFLFLLFYFYCTLPQLQAKRWCAAMLQEQHLVRLLQLAFNDDHKGATDLFSRSRRSFARNNATQSPASAGGLLLLYSTVLLMLQLSSVLLLLLPWWSNLRRKLLFERKKKFPVNVFNSIQFNSMINSVFCTLSSLAFVPSTLATLRRLILNLDSSSLLVCRRRRRRRRASFPPFSCVYQLLTAHLANDTLYLRPRPVRRHFFPAAVAVAARLV